MVRVGELVRKKGATVVTVAKNTDVRSAVQLLILHNIGGLPVVASDGSVIGFVSERELVRGMEAEGDELPRRTVDQMMRPPATCVADDTVREVMTRMTRERQRHLIVLDDGRAAGVISVGDMVKECLDEFEVETGALHEELERSNWELRRTVDKLVERMSEAEMATRAKSDFLSSMSHEIRTPINAIVGYIELLEIGVAGPLAEQQRAFLDRVSVSSRHLLSLIADILDLARIEAGRTELTRARVPVVRPVAAAIEIVAQEAHARRIHIAQSPMAQVQTVFEGDEDRVRQILVNLLSNAVKFTEPGGRITVTCGVTDSPPSPLQGRSGPFVFIQVADTGVGIAPADLERVFERFEQAEPQHSLSRTGAGLGLGISRELARLMGGDLILNSELGVGSTFTVWLPQHPRLSAAELLAPPSGTATVLAKSSPALPPDAFRSQQL